MIHIRIVAPQSDIIVEFGSDQFYVSVTIKLIGIKSSASGLHRFLSLLLLLRIRLPPFMHWL